MLGRCRQRLTYLSDTFRQASPVTLVQKYFSTKKCLPYARIKDSSSSKRHFPGTLLFTLEPPLDNTAMKMPSHQAKIAHFHYGETTGL